MICKKTFWNVDCIILALSKPPCKCIIEFCKINILWPKNNKMFFDFYDSIWSFMITCAIKIQAYLQKIPIIISYSSTFQNTQLFFLIPLKNSIGKHVFFNNLYKSLNHKTVFTPLKASNKIKYYDAY